MAQSTDVFAALFIFSFGLFTLLAGLFTAYFGAGKSRAIGFGLSIFGVLFLLAFWVFTWDVVPGLTPYFADNQGGIVTSLVGVAASAVGAVVALVVFLVAIMKA